MAGMRVLASAVALRGAGSRFVGESLVEALERRADVELSAWVPNSWTRVPSTFHRVGAGFPRKLLHEVSLPLRARGFDALLSLGDTGCPFPRRPHVLLVQQAHLAYSQDAWGYRPPPRFQAKLQALEAYFRGGRAGVTRFTVQTEDMKHRLIARWNLPFDRVDVIPSSVLPLPEIEPLVGVRPYLVCVTSAGAHKNLGVLPEMLAALRDRDIELRLTVDAEEVPALVSEFRRLGALNRVVFEGSVTRARAMSLLAAARCALFPSLLESFGFGYYEAMAVGCPVVAADREFAREACGDVGTYATPSSGEHFAEAVQSVVEGSRDDAARAGRARFADVAQTWDQVADSYVNAIRHAVET